MRPAIAILDVVDQATAHAVFLSESHSPFSTGKPSSDSANAFSSQFGENMIVPAGLKVSALGVHVGHVVGAGSKEDVVWIDAAPIVAAVQAARAFGQGAVDQFPREPMCEYHSSLHWRVGAVAVASNVTTPLPAARALGDLGPKAVGDGADFPGLFHLQRLAPSARKGNGNR